MERYLEVARTWALFYRQMLYSLGWETEVTAMVDYDRLTPTGFFSVKLPAAIINDLSLIVTVKDNSMTDFDLYPGDEIIIKLQSSFRNGDTVLCVIDDKVMVKTWYKGRGGRVWFLSRDKNVKPIRETECNPFVVGIVQKVKLRSLRADIDYEALIEEEEKARTHKYLKTDVDDCIKRIAQSVTSKRLWFGVYRTLVDYGFIHEGDWQTFVSLVTENVEGCDLCVTDLRRLNIGCFAQPVSYWKREKSPFPRSFNDYLNVAYDFRMMITGFK